MLEGWLSAAQALGWLITFAGTLAEKKRSRVAVYLDDIAKNLSEMADAVEHGRKFGTHCIKLQTTSNKLYDVRQGTLQTRDC